VPVKVGIWIFTALLVLLIGFSRIYFGVHNATDVIG
jgi:membrane-associated phospholipid phosphatase